MLEMRARLILSRQTLGGLVGPETFYDTVTHRTVTSIDNSGHNWSCCDSGRKRKALLRAFDDARRTGDARLL